MYGERRRLGRKCAEGVGCERGRGLGSDPLEHSWVLLPVPSLQKILSFDVKKMQFCAILGHSWVLFLAPSPQKIFLRKFSQKILINFQKRAWVALWWCSWPGPAGDVCGTGLIPMILDVKTNCILECYLDETSKQFSI